MQPTGSQTLATRIEQRRQELHLSQGDLAKRAGCVTSHISHFENQRRMPSIQVAMELADALETSVDWLVGRDDSLADSPDRGNSLVAQINRAAKCLRPHQQKMVLVVAEALAQQGADIDELR